MRIRASLPCESIVIRVRRTISTVSRSIGELAVWIASPIDLVPKFIPIAGPLDDAIVAALVLRHLLRRTDRSVLFDHWRGDPATLQGCY